MSGIVAIIGSPNVGKSTLFNRLIEERKAIVDDTSGTTRDRHYGTCEWNGKIFTVIDTGGYVAGSGDVFEKAIREQAEIAMEEAEILIFMTDLQSRITPMDLSFTEILRKSRKKILLVVNKTDEINKTPLASEFYSLGFKELFPISALSGQGTGELLDRIAELLLSGKSETEDDNIPRIAVIGKPNVGKSTLINAWLGEERNIVTEIPGTTRDSIHSLYNKFGHRALLIDTAGLRKKARVKENIEFYSTLRTIRSIEECDVAVILLDASEGIGAQDLHIIFLAEKNKKGIVILINKWDAYEKNTGTAKEYEEIIQKKIEPLTNIPILFVSALKKQKIMQAMETALSVYEERKKKIITAVLNKILLKEIENYPPSSKGSLIRIKYVSQIKIAPPVFAFFCNRPQSISDSYKRFLSNKIHGHFGFRGVPLTLVFKKK